ncbi:MAG: hypothetical protein WA160_02405 [Pseudobdellovibrio sp.]
MRKLLIFTFTIIIGLISNKSVASVAVSVEYSEAANVFDLLDNVSNWWEGFCEEEYQKFWSQKFGLTESDKQLFSEYKILREKYYKDPDQAEKDPLKNRNGFFSTLSSVTADPVAEAFYSSEKLSDAYKNLEAILTVEELGFLKKFHKQFEDNYAVLLKESASFKKIAKIANLAFKKPSIKVLFDDASRFYGVKEDLSYRVLYVWWPPIERSQSSPTGKFLLMRYNPIKHADIAGKDADIVFHEIVHTISARQGLNQKQALTKEFLKACPVQYRMKKLKVLEEPLAVAIGQLLYLKRVEPKRLDLSAKAYNDPWISAYGKMLFPVVDEYMKNKRGIVDFVKPATAICNELVKMSEKLVTK